LHESRYDEEDVRGTIHVAQGAANFSGSNRMKIESIEKMKRQSCILCFLVIVAHMAMSTACANTSGGYLKSGDYEDVSGAWLIDSQPYDFFINSGVFWAEYPAVIISPDGQFRAYIIGRECVAHNINLAVSPSDKEVQFDCINGHAARQKDLHGGLAVLVTKGKIKRQDDGMLRLVPDDQRFSISDMMARSSKSGEKIKYGVFYLLTTQPVDPARLSFQTVPYHQKKLTYSFSKYPGEILADAAATPHNLNTSTSKYFRCILNAYTRAAVESTPFSDEIIVLRKLMREHGLLFDAEMEGIKKWEMAEEIKRNVNATDVLKAEEKKLRSESEAEIEQMTKKLGVVVEQLIVTPAYKAAEANKLGEYLGCPERDRRSLPTDIFPQINELGGSL
jgi:hypothetical protein